MTHRCSGEVQLHRVSSDGTISSEAVCSGTFDGIVDGRIQLTNVEMVGPTWSQDWLLPLASFPAIHYAILCEDPIKD